MNKPLTYFGCILAIILSLYGCGGGGGTDSQTPISQASTATITFGTINNINTTSIRGIELKMKLPSSLSVKTNPTDPTQIDSSVLKSLKSTALSISGTYTASTNEIHIFVFDNPTNTVGLGFGNFAQLTCNLQSGISVSLVTLQAPTLFDVGGPNGIIIPNIQSSITIQ